MDRTLVAAVALALLAGCPTRVPIRPDAFDKGQHAAILLLHAYGKINPFQHDSVKGGAVLDATPVLAAVRPVIIDAMARNPHFRLVPEQRVFAAPSYVALSAAPGSWGYISPPPYKSATNESLYPIVAREVGADMAMGLMLQFTYMPVSGAAMVTLSIGVIGSDGRGIWTGGSVGISELPIDVTSATPQARIEAFKDAARKAMVRLEQAMTEQLAEQRASIR